MSMSPEQTHSLQLLEQVGWVKATEMCSLIALEAHGSNQPPVLVLAGGSMEDLFPASLQFLLTWGYLGTPEFEGASVHLCPT